MIAILHFGYCESFLADLSVLYVNKQTIRFLAWLKFGVWSLVIHELNSLFGAPILFLNLAVLHEEKSN